MVVGGLLFSLAAVACVTSGVTSDPPRADSERGGSQSGGAASSEAPATTAGDSANPSCEVPPGEPFVGEPRVELTDLGGSNGVSVAGAVYPHPDYEGNPWSQWGQGIVLPDGRFYSAIGDHIGPDGNSYIYEYDPGTGDLAMVGDVLSYVDHQAGSWGYGKIHGQMVAGPCGEVYISTYWGTYREIRFDASYSGDILMRLDPNGHTLTSLGVPMERLGTASLAGSAQHGLVFGEAVDPVLKQDSIDRGPFFVFDMMAEETVFVGPEEPHVGYRAMIVDEEGKAYYSIGGGELAVYDPETNELGTHPHALPGDWLRAATPPGPDGSIFGVTRDPDTFFVMRPSGEIESLGAAEGYTASMALSPDGAHFYYMPHAHGGAWEAGSPLIRVDTSTGEQEVVVELNPIVEESLGLTVGGTYNIAISPAGDTIYMGANAGTVGSDSTFEEVVLLVIHLP